MFGLVTSKQQSFASLYSYESVDSEYFLNHMEKSGSLEEAISQNTKVCRYFSIITVLGEHKAHLMFNIFRLSPRPTESETLGS